MFCGNFLLSIEYKLQEIDQKRIHIFLLIENVRHLLHTNHGTTGYGQKRFIFIGLKAISTIVTHTGKLYSGQITKRRMKATSKAFQVLLTNSDIISVVRRELAIHQANNLPNYNNLVDSIITIQKHPKDTLLFTMSLLEKTADTLTKMQQSIQLAAWKFYARQRISILMPESSRKHTDLINNWKTFMQLVIE